MAPPATITFLGTSSAVPSLTRNHSSLALTLPSGSTFLFDAGEATQHQLQKISGGFKVSSLKKIFITHMHGDHMFGVVPLLCTLLNGAGGSVGVEDPRKAAAEQMMEELVKTGLDGRKPDIEIYGPEGLREYIRSSLRLTRSLLGGCYVVHELRLSPADGTTRTEFREQDTTLEHSPMELTGYNLFPNEKGVWLDILKVTESPTQEWTVSAGPILHSVPCVGYVLTEPPLPGKITTDYKEKLLANKEALVKKGVKNPMALLSKVSALAEGEAINLPNGDKLTRPPDRRGRKVTILGDTYDPSGISELAFGSDVLIHEATNAFLGERIPREINRDYKEGETYQDVEKKTIEHGHSTPEMAAAFAIKIGLGEGGGVLGRIIAAEDSGKREKGKVEDARPRGVLLLNHFSSRYADPRSSEASHMIMRAIGECAAGKILDLKSDQEEKRNIHVVCSHDLMQYEIRASD